MDTILVANAGSSSVKFEVFGVDQAGGLSSQLEGKIEGVGTKPHLTAKSAEGKVLVERTYTNETVPHVPAALHTAGAWLRDELHIHPIAVGHRVVHGGPEFDQPVLVTEDVLHRLERYIPLAPLHQPHNLAPIRSIMVNRPGLPQVACFDTAFHRKHRAVADHYAIPAHFYAEGIRRYGFHGLSYEYIAATPGGGCARHREEKGHRGPSRQRRIHVRAEAVAKASRARWASRRWMGLPMGTRAGQIDPGVVLYLIEQKGMSARRGPAPAVPRLRAQRLIRHQQRHARA